MHSREKTRMGDYKRLGRQQRPRRSGGRGIQSRDKKEQETVGNWGDKRDQRRCIAGRGNNGRLGRQ